MSAEDLKLATTADDILKFINNNLGEVALRLCRSTPYYFVVPGSEKASPSEKLNMIKIHINEEEEEIQRNILKSLDLSSYIKKDLVELVRSKIEEVKKSQSSGFGLQVYKDEIFCLNSKREEGFFFPQLLSKLCC